MKPGFNITVFLLPLLFICCRKSPTDGPGLVGKWTLVETLADPGNGSGKWTAVNSPGYYFLQFNTNNSIETNAYPGLGGLKRYKVINDSTVNFIYGNGDTFTLSYKINGDSLTLEGGCIERCGSKYTRKISQH